MEPIEYRPSRLRVLAYGIGAALFVAGGLWMARSPEMGIFERTIGWVGVAFFGLGVVLFLLEMIRPRIRLRMDEHGIDVRPSIGATGYVLPWAEIKDVEIWALSRSPVLIFETRDPYWGRKGQNRIGAALRRANETILESSFTLSCQMFGVRAETLLAEIERRRAFYAPDAEAAYPRGLL